MFRRLGTSGSRVVHPCQMRGDHSAHAKAVFEVLMNAVRCCSRRQITNALFEVGGSIGGACSRSVAGKDQPAASSSRPISRSICSVLGRLL